MNSQVNMSNGVAEDYRFLDGFTKWMLTILFCLLLVILPLANICRRMK